MKVILSLLIFLFLVPQHDSGKLPWDENRKLKWEDFHGTPVSGANFVASTNSGISFGYSYTIENNKVKVEYSVESFFNTKKSWFIPGKVSQHILNHEQAHFDISELHTRILKKRLDGQKFSRKIKTEIETIYRQVEQERKTMQIEFDAESNHSRNEEKEIYWQKYIAKRLAEHDEWK